MKKPHFDYCLQGSPMVPKWQCSVHKHSPFEIYPVATWTLVIFLSIAFIALLFINF